MGKGSFEIQPTIVGTKQRILMKQNEGEDGGRRQT